jgi:hypothetical protein
MQKVEGGGFSAIAVITGKRSRYEINNGIDFSNANQKEHGESAHPVGRGV